mmetsp:Transcript_14951/g.45140  ORF Transcript_14951/g.45140 Transcript_14951/m.45140 type:complete len:351 (-) Transcript_14951:178-1230(-)
MPPVTPVRGGRAAAAVADVQRALQLSHGLEETELLEAARLLVGLAESRGGTPAGPELPPLYHALGRLLEADSRMATAQAARAAKLFLVNDGFRRGGLGVGFPGALLRALHRLDDDVNVLRELFGALQSLTWDPETVLSVVAPAGGSDGDPEEGIEGCVPHVLEMLEARDEALVGAALACLANALAWADTKLLKQHDTLRAVVPLLDRLFALARAPNRLHVLYACACIANASSHPLLAGALRDADAPRLLRVVQENAEPTMTLGGVHLETCISEALDRLNPNATLPGVVEAGLPRAGRKFRFLFGQAPTVELSLSTAVCNRTVQAMTCLWIFAMVWLLRSTLVATHGDFGS